MIEDPEYIADAIIARLASVQAYPRRPLPTD
jgi:hypothetical protein